MRRAGRVFDPLVTTIERPAASPVRRTPRLWGAAVRAGALLALVLAGYWLLTPHLSTDAPAWTTDGEPAGDRITVPTAEGLGPQDRVGSTTSFYHVTNHGLLPVTLTVVGPSELTGPGSGVVHLVGSERSDASALPEVTLGRGEQAVVRVDLEVTACTQTGGAQARTGVSGLEVDARTGPVTRRTALDLSASLTVVAEDGSDLPACAG